jgi:NAD-dependent SIR2 family protein deacetylase
LVIIAVCKECEAFLVPRVVFFDTDHA